MRHNTRKNTEKPKRKLHPAMEARKWKKGDPSPNPGGRPKTMPITEALQALLGDPKNAAAIAKNLFIIAKGKRKDATKAIALLTDRVEGKVSQPVDVGGQIQLVVDL